MGLRSAVGGVVGYGVSFFSVPRTSQQRNKRRSNVVGFAILSMGSGYLCERTMQRIVWRSGLFAKIPGALVCHPVNSVKQVLVWKWFVFTSYLTQSLENKPISRLYVVSLHTLKYKVDAKQTVAINNHSTFVFMVSPHPRSMVGIDKNSNIFGDRTIPRLREENL